MAQEQGYQAAERKIAEARRVGAKDFTISFDQSGELTELPESLRQLTQLETLSVSNCGLSALPTWLGQLTNLRVLVVGGNQLTALPDSISQLAELDSIDLGFNQLTELPASFGKLAKLRSLDLGGNRWSAGALFPMLARLPKLESLSFPYASSDIVPFIANFPRLLRLSLQGLKLKEFPSEILNLTRLEYLCLYDNYLTQLPEEICLLRELNTLDPRKNQLEKLPESIDKLEKITTLFLDDNKFTDLPPSILNLKELRTLSIDENPLNPELDAANKEGFDAVKRYLKARAQSQVSLNEAKLIVVGEGEVGKSCLLSALRDEPWVEGNPTTHGIEIKPVRVTHPETGAEVILNGWDFGGQRVYRPTHQLFFSAPAIFLVVWKPREGPQQGFVKEWITLVKHRAAGAKIIIVATHGGAKERQPDIDRQEIWDQFGKEMVVDFCLTDSKPDVTGERRGIAELKQTIARVAASLPEMGRQVPRRWVESRHALQGGDAPYMPLTQVLQLCSDHEMDQEEANDFVRISHRLGHLIHYEHDPLLQDIVILKPDWLSTAISFVLDDAETRSASGLVSFERLRSLWSDPKRRDHYPPSLHGIFLRLMERYDLSYRVADGDGRPGELSLIAQLVPDVRPLEGIFNLAWPAVPQAGDEERMQICRVVDAKSAQSASAEGLFFQLIVRLHRYSLGFRNYAHSVHWQRGVILEDNYGARALFEHIGNDVRITVRSPYPEQFLSALTYDVKWLVESFWEGLRCDVMVPCIEPCGRGAPGSGSFEVEKLIDSKRRRRPEYPCPVCDDWQEIERLLHNAPAARPNPLEELLSNSTETIRILTEVRRQVGGQHVEVIGRFDRLGAGNKELVSKVEASYADLMRTLIDEAKDGPRLFSFEPIEPGFFDRPGWISEKFRLTLWCEHSRLPLPVFSARGEERGVYELNLPRDWVVKAAPFLKILTATLGLVVPLSSAAAKLALEDVAYKGIEKQLELGQKCIDSALKGAEKAGSWLSESNAPEMERGGVIRAEGAVLRELHAWLKEKDPSFGGLVRVQNRRREFLWVHQKFATEY